MSNDAQQLAAIVLACSLAFAIAGCKKNPFGERSSEVVGIAQVPAPVKATIDRQAGGRAIGGNACRPAVSRRTDERTLRCAVGDEEKNVSEGWRRRTRVGLGYNVFVENAG